MAPAQFVSEQQQHSRVECLLEYLGWLPIADMPVGLAPVFLLYDVCVCVFVCLFACLFFCLFVYACVSVRIDLHGVVHLLAGAPDISRVAFSHSHMRTF